MDVVGDLVTRDRDVSGVVLRTAGGEPGRSYEYHRFATTAMKAGNFLRLHGMRAGTTVAIVPTPTPEPVFGLLGAALLGATVRFDPTDRTEATVLLAPADDIGTSDSPPGTTRIAYGGAPDDPAVERFERGLWSENPTFPPTTIEPTAPFLGTPTGSLTHRALLRAADSVVDAFGIDGDTAVAMRASMASPWGLVAGILAPLAVGATVVLPRDGTGRTDADLAVAAGDAPEPVAIGPDAVSFPR